MKFCLSLFVALVAGGGVTTTAEAHFLPHKKHLDLAHRISYFKRSIDHDRRAVVWLRRAQFNLQHGTRALASDNTSFHARVRHQLEFHRTALKWYRKLLARAQRTWDRLHPPLPPHYRDWLCIHSYEGSWTDDGAPYYGGLQMDISFQTHYGGALLRRKGTANNWTPLEQMWVAERAYASGRGFYPWPNTARYCGLI